MSKLFNKIGLNKSLAKDNGSSVPYILTRLMKDLLTLIIYLVFIIHILSCTWIYIGITVDNTWLDGFPETSTGKF